MAELFRKPLFQITCGQSTPHAPNLSWPIVDLNGCHFYAIGDLGTTASQVETALETNFALANRWGCILLLDEADVFLTTRSPEDFVRNGLVAGLTPTISIYLTA